MDLTARITVTRDVSNDFFGRLYPVILSLDGERVARLMPGESVTRDIAMGHHRLRAFNTCFWKTREFEAQPGEHVRFITANRAGLGTLGIAAMFGIGPLYVDLEQERDVSHEGGLGREA